MKRHFYTLDVFTSTPFAGNPLAVVTDGDGLPKARMQAIAREMNLSETVFIQRPTDARALARLRIFTTTQELPLAGHPVIGTWFLLAELGVARAAKTPVRILQQTGAGILPVEISFKHGRPEMVAMTQKAAEFDKTRVNRSALAGALGLRVSDFHPTFAPEFVSTGIFNLMVPLKNRDALKRIKTDVSALSKAMSRAVMAYCFALGPKGCVFARGMLPWAIVEDPATGSSAGSAGAYSARHGFLQPEQELLILQGVEMGLRAKSA